MSRPANRACMRGKAHALRPAHCGGASLPLIHHPSARGRSNAFLISPPHTCSSRPDPVPQQLLEAAMCDLRTQSPAPDIALQPRASQPTGQAGVSPRPPRQRVQGAAVHVHMHARHVRGHTLWEACRCFHIATTCGLTAGPHDRASLLGARSHWRCAVHPLMFPAAHITAPRSHRY